jgi:hypothetical protein
VTTCVVSPGRRHERTPVNVPVFLIVGPTECQLEHPCRVIEGAKVGLRLKTTVPLTPGQTVLILSGEEARYAVRGRVVWFRKIDPDPEGEAGLEFIG